MRKLKTPVSTFNERFVDVTTAIYAMPRSYDAVIEEKRVDAQNNEYTVIPNDISLFIKVQKEQLFDGASEGLLKDFKKQDTSLTAAFAGVSDSELLSSVKSRYIQSTTDLHNYTRALSESLRDEIESRRRSFSARRKSEPDKKKDSEPDKKD